MSGNVIQINFGDGTKDVKILRHLGSGAFGNVLQVQDSNGQTFALKVFVGQNSTQSKGAVQEIQRLSALQHTNIVKVFTADIQYDLRGTPAINILVEFCNGGNLSTRLSTNTLLDTNLKWMMQIADALQYLHEKNIVHCDLKPGNIFLSHENDVKVADFGLARVFSGGGGDNEWIATYLKTYKATVAGTPFWIAPEVLKGHYTEKADVFSLGIIVFCIAERQHSVSARYQGSMLAIGQILHEDDEIDASKLLVFTLRGATRGIKELILDLLERQPGNRPTAMQVYNRIKKLRSTCGVLVQLGGANTLTSGVNVGPARNRIIVDRTSRVGCC